MKFMVIVKADKDSEAGVLPSEQLLSEMTKYNEELVAGYWIWQCKSMEEAVEWVKKCPNPMNGESEIEIRQVFENEDFGEAFTPELREKEEKMRRQMEAKN